MKECQVIYVDFTRKQNESVTDRLARIKQGLAKINKLMTELKQIQEVNK